MLYLNSRCRKCCCKHYEKDYCNINPETSLCEPEALGAALVRLATEEV